MHKVILVREQDHYVMSDNNDERLFVLSELLRNQTIRSMVQKALKNPQQTHEKNEDFTIEQDEKNAHIKLYHVHEAITKTGKPLTIDISRKELMKCINLWLELIKHKPHLIILTRQADQFSLQASKE